MGRAISSYDRALVEGALELAGRDVGQGRRRAPCPLCERARGKPDHKLAVYCHADGGWVCFRCGATGWLPGHGREATARFRVGLRTRVQEAPGMHWKRPPPGFLPLYGGDSEDDQRLDLHRAYVEHRGVPREVAQMLHIGGAVEGFLAWSVVVPVLDDSADPPTWNGWVSRVLYPSDDPADPVYREPAGAPKGTYVYRQSVLRAATNVPALGVEGVFDAMPYHPNAVALLGKVTPTIFALLLRELRESGRPFVFVPDGDAWAQADAYALALRAAGVRSGCIRLPPRVDPDEVPADVVEGAALDALASPYPVLVGEHDLGL